MTGKLTIALDAMGGDHAPEAVIRGALIARKRFPDVGFILVGDEAQIVPLLDEHKVLRDAVEVRHTLDVISPEDKPSAALRAGKRSSMRLAIEEVKLGNAAGVVSGGNTGALLAFTKIVLRALPGIDRPAMAGFVPTRRGESIMLDLGANLTCDAENLVQFAILGEVFARTVFGIEKPTVGLLNVGTEDQKGHEAVRDAASVLRQSNLPIGFHGFVEGVDIASGTVDVVVTDGWSGNIAIKTAEGTGKLLNAFLREAFRSSILARIGYLFASGAFRKLRKRIDPRRYNGAVFLGINGIAVKSHGGSDAFGFATAIGVAVDMARYGFVERAIEDFASLLPPATGVRAATV
ncbi:MAG: phosphate acyltransferase PlsX [Alphaproteobacteria bacterium]|nr:phosphate acyltransferase PlsX [Alphaproteobacteria bacterium]